MTGVVVMGIMTFMPMMMFDDDKDGVATVMREILKLTVGLAEPNVHLAMMLVMMDMTVLEAAEVITIALLIGITTIRAKTTVMVVVSPPDIN